MSCTICEKHRKFKSSGLTRFDADLGVGQDCGAVVAHRGGWFLTHFPRLDDEPTGRGHLLIEPQRHILDLSDMNSEEAAALGELMSLGASLLKSELGAEHVYVQRINDKVPHLHFHLISRFSETPREFWGLKLTSWPDRPKASPSEVQSAAQRLRTRARELGF